jgi:hypothetical protein
LSIFPRRISNLFFLFIPIIYHIFGFLQDISSFKSRWPSTSYSAREVACISSWYIET